ncbi:MAG: protein translocase subunit SecF [Candidatus Marinamargulisbacteria bacterium]|nr:protein translocase subunit SecF [bacterium]MDG2264823.1 protein translocase subunit SecF [Candidatus Marinamargulisbacteria bacterium]
MIVEKRNLWISLSLLIVGIGVALMIFRLFAHQPVLNFGIDFTGGSTVLIAASDSKNPLLETDVPTVHTVLTAAGFDHYWVQVTRDHEMIIKTELMGHDTRSNILSNIRQQVGPIDLLEADTIGPSIGKELRQQSIWMALGVGLMLLLYISLRFQWTYGVAALIALAHDGLITISIAAMLLVEVNTAFVAALLMILGYSINDTIVVFDRVRELANNYEDQPMAAVANLAIRQTIRRSIYTSVTTALVVGALLIFGGVTLKGFCIVLLIGIVSGTYSSIFIASPILVGLRSPR